MEDLQVVNVAENSLRSLGLKHSSVVFEELYATNNPELACIEVLDERYHTNRFSFENNNIDEGVTFSTICNATTYQPQSKDELIEAVYAWTMGDFLTYGNISDWDVSLITDMSHLFENKTSFNDDLSLWDVSSVTNMNHMFKNASNFNQNIGGWDVSNVFDMGAMFLGAANFNQDIGNWNVASVTSMSHMFVSASNFNQNIGGWDVSNVITMQAMFKSANSFSQSLNTWNVSNVIHMNYMFEANNGFNGDISEWNTSSVIGMHKMFIGANSFDKDISNWDVSNVLDMGAMFLGAAVFNQDLSGWEVSNVTNMSGVFNNTGLSILNQCLIHNAWSLNPNWEYDWYSTCSPVIVEIENLIMDEDSELKIPLLATDPLNVPFYFETNVYFPSDEFFQAHIIHDPDRGTDTLHLVAINNYFGQAEVDVTVHNENGDMDTEGFMVEILPVDDLPIVGGIIQDIFVEEDFNHNQDPNWNVHLNDVFFDIDGDLEYEVSFSDPAVVNANVENEHLTLSSIENAFGETDMFITASNPMRASVTDTVLVTVFPVNDAPVITQDNTTYVTACHPYHIENGYGGNFFGVSPDLQSQISVGDVIHITQGDQVYPFTVSGTTLVNNEFCVDEEGNFLNLYVYIEGTLSVTFGESLMVGSLVSLPEIPIEFDEDTVYEMMSFEEMYNNGSLADVDNDLGELSFDIFTHNDNIYLEWDGSSSSHPMIIPENNYYGPASLTICVFDSEYDSCIEKNFNIAPINDAPEFHSSMDEVVGVNLEFHIDVHVDDVDSENVTLSLGENSPNWVNLSDNILQGEPADLGEYSIQLIATDGQLTTESTLHLHVENFNPEIISITDVPDDQGGRVYLQFNASYFDHHDHSGQSYNIYRHDDDLSEWVVLSSVAATGDGVYIYEATTLMDSTSESNGLTDFWVKASMHEGTFESEIVSGYSVDNILPGVPEGVLASLVDNTVEVTWNESIDEDFQYFVIEKTVNNVEEFIETSDAFFLDENYLSNAVHSYRIASVDHAGNQSEYSDVVEVAVLGIDGELIPAVFTLYQNYPNPFNPTTQIKYDLPKDAMVTINIYDVLGRMIKSLLNDNQTAGYHSLQWDATNDIGEGVSAGMYIYTIQAGEYQSTKKMVLLK
jgi:surface protein